VPVHNNLPPDIIRTLMLMNNDITRDAPLDKLRAIPELGLDLLDRPPLLEFARFYSQTPQRLMKLPRFIGDAFIEAFSINQPAATAHLENKALGKVGLEIKLPVPIPVLFDGETEPGKWFFGFYDTPLLSAADVEQRVSSALNTFAHREMLVAEFGRIDLPSEGGFSSEKLDDFARRWDVVVLKSEGQIDQTFECRSYTLKIIKMHWSPEKEQGVKKELLGLFDQYRIAYCSVCGLVYCVGEGGQCVSSRHAKRQIPFPNGKMVDERTGADGKRFKCLKFECCGEVPEQRDGCVQLRADAHLEDSSRRFSVLTVTAAHVF
jgi:hypothetical protein